MQLRLRPAVRGHGVRCVLLLAAAWGLILHAAGASLVNKPAPEFVRADVRGQSVDLAAYRGRVVLLTFWATWCAPCLNEIPHWMEWQRRYGREGFGVIGVSMDDDAAQVRRLVKKRRMNYPVVMGDARLGELYGGVLGLPVTYLIDRRGVVAARFQGATDLGALQRRVEQLVAER